MLVSAVLSGFRRFQLCETLWTVARQAPLTMDSAHVNIGVGCYALFQGIFPAQGSNLWPLLRLVHCRQILYCGATLEAWFLLYNKGNQP